MRPKDTATTGGAVAKRFSDSAALILINVAAPPDAQHHATTIGHMLGKPCTSQRLP